MAKKAIRARKILTEFNLKDGKKLRIDVMIWGDATYAQKMGYYGNIVYIPILVSKDGISRCVYSGRTGLPKLTDLDNFYERWKDLLSSEKEKRRLREVAITLRELAEEMTYLNSRDAHVVYKLLEISRKEPIFKVNKLRDTERLSARMWPALFIEFDGYRYTRAIKEYEYGTLLFKVLKSMNRANDKIEHYISAVKHDLVLFVKMNKKGRLKESPRIRLEAIADEIQELVTKLH
jgi:hypothetical protein